MSSGEPTKAEAEMIDRALASGRLLERQAIRSWINRRKNVTLNPKVEAELDDIILLLGNGEYEDDT